MAELRLVFGAALGLLTLVWAHAAPAEPATSASTVIYRGAVIIDGTGAPARAGFDLIVRGEMIAGVVAEGADTPKDAEVVDVRGLYLLPGLIDSHVHLATPPDRTQAEGVLRRQLYSGVTAVRDMADDLRSVAELAREARMAEIPAPDIYFAAIMAGPTFFDDPRTAAAAQGWVPGTAPWMQSIDADTNLPLAIAMARGTGATAVKIYANLPPEHVRAIAEEARRQGLKVWAHGMVFPTLPNQVLDARPDVVSHTCYMAYQLSAKPPQSYQDQTPVDPEPFAKGENPAMTAMFARMRAQGTILDPTVRVYVAGEERYAETGKGRPPRCASRLAADLTAQAFRAGVPISAGTDGETDWREAYPSLHEELEYLSAKVGMPNSQVIRSATQVGAMSLGQADRMGVIAPGKLANLFFVEKDPIADIANLRTVAFTVKRGRVYKRQDYSPITAAEGERP